MSEPPTSDLSSLRIDRGASKRRRRSAWPRLILLALVVGALWLFQRPLLDLVNRIRLPEVQATSLVRLNPSSSSGARGAAANGYVVARTRAALSAERPGRIVELNVVEGTKVSQGEVVARLDSTEQEAALASARAEVVVAQAGVARAEADVARARADRTQSESAVPTAEANLEATRADLEFARRESVRFEELVRQGVAEERRRDEVERDLARAQALELASAAELEAARLAVTVAERRIDAAERVRAEAEARQSSAVAAVQAAEAALEKTFVRAPFDGVIVLKEAEVGEVVSPNSQGGSTARGSVATMVDFASLEVQAEVPETTLSAVHRGGPARVYLDAFPEEPYGARIDRIWPTADRTKATVEVRVAFDAPDDRLRPDMGVRVVFLDEEPPASAAPETGEALLLMPSDALVTLDGERGVFVLERDQVRFQPVTTGEVRSGRLVVEAGLSGEERVVLSPPTTLTDGDRVRIKP